jgi:hypothetical protein
MILLGPDCQMLSPDGRYLFFTRDGDIYWVDASVYARLLSSTPNRQ